MAVASLLKCDHIFLPHTIDLVSEDIKNTFSVLLGSPNIIAGSNDVDVAVSSVNYCLQNISNGVDLSEEVIQFSKRPWAGCVSEVLQ